MNAEAVNRSRVDGILNLIQYFEGNPDYTLTEKALIVKGAMTWGVVEKKSGEANEVKLVRMTDSNDISVPVIGGEAAAVVEGLRRGMNFKDALKEGRGKLAENPRRSVPGTYIGWKVYRKSSREEDAAVLQQDAAGTGWCTGGALGTARSHLSGGDFHIYFEGGEPLIAIRTQDGRMAEPPRGAHEGQFCTSREEQLAFDYIKAGNGITAGDDYVSDIEDMRRVMSPDATWRDVWMMPERRRYENGEFGGDTRSWGVAVESRMKELLDGIGKEERWEEGYFLASEVTESKASKIRFVRGDLGVGIGATLKTPALQKVVGILDVGKGATLDAPALQKVERVLFVRKGATFIAPALQNVVGRLDVDDGATLNAPFLCRNFSVSDGTVYGYVLNGVIHLTPEGINPETPIHEYSHLWLTAYRKEHPDRWARLCNELERNGFTKLVSGDPSYSFLASDREAVCEETVCRIVGEKGAETLMSLSLGADSAKALVKFFRDLVNGYAVKEVFQAGGLGEELSAVTIAVLRDFAGKNPDKAKQKIDVIPPQKPDSKKTRFIRQKYR